MKKNILTLLVFAAVIVFMASCDKLKPKYNVEAMVEDYVKYQEEGDSVKAQKLFNKLVELKDQVTDDQFFAMEPYLTPDEVALFDEEEENYVSTPYVTDDEEYVYDEEDIYDVDEENVE